MPKKRNFHLDKTYDEFSEESLFDKLVQEVEVDEVPVEYIERIVVYYESGEIVELGNHEVNKPIPINQESSWEEMNESFKSVSGIKVYVNTKKLEKDVNKIIEPLLSFLPKAD